MRTLHEHSAEIIAARYRSLLHDVPVAIATGICAVLIQILALRNIVDWNMAVFFPLCRMLVGLGLFGLWLSYRRETPTLVTMRRRMTILSGLMVLSGILNVNRNLWLLDTTQGAEHYFLIFHATMYGLCFAFILVRIGWAAYALNAIFIASALLSIYLGHIEHKVALTALVLMFEFAMLIAMRTSNQSFDRAVIANAHTQSLLEDNQRLANQDTLTQLPNRRHFFMRLDAAIANTHETPAALTVGILDVDHFKPVNDRYGHHAGDIVLKTMAERLLALEEATLHFYRLGGDEFALILQRTVSIDDLQRLAQRIHQQLSRPIAIGETSITLGTSIGACMREHAQETSQQLYEQADIALYQAKKHGGAQFKVYIHAVSMREQQQQQQQQ